MAVPTVVVVALGGVLGSLARYAIDLAIGNPDLAAWPWNTLLVNVVGALVIGMLASSGFIRNGPDWRWPFAITGVLGGFTTFSAFALEAGVMLDAGRIVLAGVYVVTTLAAGFLAVRIGVSLVRSR